MFLFNISRWLILILTVMEWESDGSAEFFNNKITKQQRKAGKESKNSTNYNKPRQKNENSAWKTKNKHS